MTPDELRALADRVVACRHWRWVPGMRVTLSSGLVVRLADHDEGSLWWATITGGATCIVDVRHPSYTVAPDLSDPATLGCLLALVREAWRCPVITSPDYDYDEEEARQGETVIGWRTVETVRWVTVGEGVSEAEALVAALEAAP